MGQIDVTVLAKKGSPKLVQGSTGVFIKLIEPKEGQSFVDAHNNCTTLMFEQQKDGSLTFFFSSNKQTLKLLSALSSKKNCKKPSLANKSISDLLNAFK